MLRNGGLLAVLSYIGFFPGLGDRLITAAHVCDCAVTVQRTAFDTACSLVATLPPDAFNIVRARRVCELTVVHRCSMPSPW